MLLTCSCCGTEFTATPAIWRCTHCSGPLEWQGPDAFDRSMIDPAYPGLWRYWKSFPVRPEGAITFHETMTPLVPVEIDGAGLHLKLDSQLPTGSFKDRGMSVLISYLAGEGIKRIAEDSSGNAAASVAAYGARAGLDCGVFAPATASPGKLVQASAYNATLVPINGTRDDVSRAAEMGAAADPLNAYASHNWHPFFIEGVKSWAFETWEQLGFEAPDAVIAPAGSGSIILGAYRAFSALKAGGEITTLPRIYAAQAQACAPLAVAMATNAEDTVPFRRQQSIAEGIMIANPVRGSEILQALRATNGGVAALGEDDIERSLVDLAKHGIYVEPTSATAFGAWRALIDSGQIRAGERVVILMTGHGLKATSAIAKILSA